MKLKITSHVDCNNINRAGKRGIIKLRDRFGQSREFYDHQIVAAQRLWLKDFKTPFHQRKAGVACIHDMGMGTPRELEPHTHTHTLDG